MTRLLLRLCVRDYDHPSSPAVRAAVGKLAGITGIVCNILLFLFKLTLGLFSGSVAVMADAANNLSDVSSSVITLVAFRISQKPADRDHPYGHARYEYLAGLAVAFLILLIGSQLVVNSLERIVSPVTVQFSALSLILLAVSSLVKLWMSLFFRSLGRHIQSAALTATAVDCRNDVLATAAVLISCITHYVFRVNIDAYIGLAVAVFILYSGFNVAKDTISPLLGAQADKSVVERLETLIASHDKILGIHDLLIHDYGPGRCFASVHAEVSRDEDPMTTHDLLDAIERAVMEQMNIRLVIHYDPIDTSDPLSRTMRQTVEAIVHTIDDRFTLHDFRLLRDEEPLRLLFDLAVPFGTDKHAVKRQIDSVLAAQNILCVTDIVFDEQE